MGRQTLFLLPCWSLVLLSIIVALLPACHSQVFSNNCRGVFDPSLHDRGQSCENKRQYPYLPILNGVYCYNNGTGICKAFAGQFEFYFNSFTDSYLKPVPQSEFVDSRGYHRRVPVGYNIYGKINYADRSINWAKKFKENLKDRKISLLSTRDFNWCAYAANDWWPYKSSIIDQKSNGSYHIYFHNRQSCIYDKKSGKPPQHFNTRFLHKSNLRIDLDYNPIIFGMEDREAGEVRLVKNKRQHWYEVRYRVIERPTPNISYFVEMSDTQDDPCTIDGRKRGCILTSKAFRGISDLCLTDKYHARSPSSPKNAILFPAKCGAEQTEMSDLSWPLHRMVNDKRAFLEVDLHNIPRYTETTTRFYGVDINNDRDWEIFAKDGYVFSAMTTIPIIDLATRQPDPRKIRVIMLYSNYRVSAESKYDEYYPLPYLADYTAEYIPYVGQGQEDRGAWRFNRAPHQKAVKYLNYVDDIAYLHTCDTILVIFGPLYSELPKDNFNIDTKAPVDSIDRLGIFEPANSFFAQPESNTLWVYHRTNWVASYQYICSTNPDRLVTATKVGRYLPRFGASQPEIFHQYFNDKYRFDFSEETLFAALGVFKGAIMPDAPDPSLYPLGDDAPAQPVAEKSNTLVYIIIGIGLLLVLAMCIACLMTFRRRKHHNNLKDLMTQRSPSLSGGISLAPSERSVLSLGRSRGTRLTSLTPSELTQRSGSLGKSDTLPSSARSSSIKPGRSTSNRPARSTSNRPARSTSNRPARSTSNRPASSRGTSARSSRMPALNLGKAGSTRSSSTKTRFPEPSVSRRSTSQSRPLSSTKRSSRHSSIKALLPVYK